MPKPSGVNHRDAVRALEKAGFRIVRESKHTIMSDGARILTLLRSISINAFTMGRMVRDTGLSIQVFKNLL